MPVDKQKGLLKVCKPCSVQLEHLPTSIINKWMKKRKESVRRPSSRVPLPEKRNKKSSRSTRRVKKRRRIKYISDDSEDEEESLPCELQFLQTKENPPPIVPVSKESERTNSPAPTVSVNHENKSNNLSVINEPQSTNIIPKPKTDRIENDQPDCEYKRKRKLSSSSSDTSVIDANEIEIQQLHSDASQSNENKSVTPIELSKEIRIVSMRLEDLDDPDVRRWQSNISKKSQEIVEPVKPTKSKISPNGKSKPRMPPKLISLECTVCCAKFESKEELSEHIFKHTARELQDAYKVAKEKQREAEKKVCDNVSEGICDSDDRLPNEQSQLATANQSLSRLHQDLVQPVTVCTCHSEQSPQNNGSVQIEMVLFCETCQVLFRRVECFETHYRLSTKCNKDRKKGRSPKLFCSTCMVILNTLSKMRRHLEEHASVNYHGTVNFVCNICRVVFFGVGTVFCNHWFNHDKDPTFVASRYSFPKLCITNQGVRPSGCAPNESYLYVAEFVCRNCKQQFSSENDLSKHQCHDSTIQNDRSITTLVLTPKATTQSTPVISAFEETNKTESQNSKAVITFRWVCDFCEKYFIDKMEFLEHSINHLQDGGYPGYLRVYKPNARVAYLCKICKSTHHNFRELTRHWLSHPNICKFICTACKKALPTIDAFQTHTSAACWTSVRNCRVRFLRESYTCKICKCSYRTFDELNYHFKYMHTGSKNPESVKNFVLTPSNHFVETPPTSEMSDSPPTKSTVIVSATNSPPPATVITTNTSNDDNVCIVVGSPVTTSLEHQPVQLESNTVNEVNDSNDTRALSVTSATDSTVTSLPMDMSSITTPLEQPNEPYPLIRSDTCLHGSELLTTDNCNNTQHGGAIAGLSEMLRAMLSSSTTSHIATHQSTINLNNDVLVIDENSKTNSDNGSVVIIDKSQDNELDKNQNRNIDIPDNDEPEIIEVSDNLKSPVVPLQMNMVNQTIISLPTNSVIKMREEKNAEKENASSVITSLQQQQQQSSVMTNSFIINTIESTIARELNKQTENSETSNTTCSSSDTQPQNFIRVKKFQELRAVKNYICEQCKAAFDNMKSLTEHLMSHANSLLGPANISRPTMMAALILPPEEANNNAESSSIVTPTTQDDARQMAGKRMLPYIPQRVRDTDARRANPLVRQDSQFNHHQQQQQYPPPYPAGSMMYQHPTNYHNNNNNQILTPPLSNTMSPHAFNYNAQQSAVNEINQINQMPSAVPDQRRLYSCKLCSYRTYNKLSIRDHIQNCHFPHNHVVMNRGVQNDTIQRDVNNYSSRNIDKCSICMYECPSSHDLAWHMQVMHPTSVRVPGGFLCIYCPEMMNFNSEESLKQHQDMFHNFTCNICYHRLESTHKLIEHMKYHSDAMQKN